MSPGIIAADVITAAVASSLCRIWLASRRNLFFAGHFCLAQAASGGGHAVLCSYRTRYCTVHVFKAFLLVVTIW